MDLPFPECFVCAYKHTMRRRLSWPVRPCRALPDAGLHAGVGVAPLDIFSQVLCPSLTPCTSLPFPDSLHLC